MTEEQIKVDNIKFCETKFGWRVLLEVEGGSKVWITPKNCIEWLNGRIIKLSTNPPRDPSHNPYKKIEGVV